MATVTTVGYVIAVNPIGAIMGNIDLANSTIAGTVDDEAGGVFLECAVARVGNRAVVA